MTVPSTQFLRNASFETLIQSLWQDSGNRQKYVDEIHRRQADPAVKAQVKAVPMPSSASTQAAHERPAANDWKDDQPPQPTPLGSTAKKYLSSGWNYTWPNQDRTTPDKVKAFLEEIANRNLSETDMSERQVKYWRTIRSKWSKR